MGASTSTFPPVLLASFLPQPRHVTSLVEAENIGRSSPQSGHFTRRKLLLGFGMNSRSFFIGYCTISAFLRRIPLRIFSLLHSLHFNFSVAFLVVFAVLISSGNFWPPYPRFLLACRLAPQEDALSLPFL